MPGALLAALFFWLSSVPAAAQTAGVIDWAAQGVADEAAFPTNFNVSSAGVTATVNWSTVTDGGSFIAASGADFVSYESGAQGGFTGYLQVGFDNGAEDPDDKVFLEVTFSTAVEDVAFTITDIDQSSWDDFVEVFYDTGSGFINAKTGSFETLGGGAVVRDNETFGDGWEGNASASSAQTIGNLAFDFGATQIVGIRIVYFASDDAAGSNPGAQQLGVSNISFTGPGTATLIASKTVAVFGGGLAIPGADVIYTISASNIGDGAADADTIFLVDAMPAEIEFYNGDIDDAGPETAAVAFSNSASGLTFSAASDVRFSNAGAPPANFSACGYTPAAGYDPNVTFVCFNPKGSLLAGAPDPSFSLSFRGRIK